MNIEYYKKFEPFFGSWYIKKYIDEGSFGKVFEIYRKDTGVESVSALKIISIPQDQSEIKSLMSDDYDEDGRKSYFEPLKNSAIEEIKLMSQLKGESNIVSYEDHEVRPHEDGIGWDIFIRMELLTPIEEYFKNKKYTNADIAKLGIDICKALELCEKKSIIHRDIKPSNIFISENSNFKLGDFGVARTFAENSLGKTKKGTPKYMAPEVYKGEKYGSTVDIYSIGLVLYNYLNYRRSPFCPIPPEKINFTHEENALFKRMKGEEKLPRPANADEELAKIILKACDYDPANRYSSPSEMREALEKYLKYINLSNEDRIYEIILDTINATSAEHTVTYQDKTDPVPRNNKTVKKPNKPENKENNTVTEEKNGIASFFKNKKILTAAVLILIVALTAVSVILGSSSKNDPLNTTASTEDIAGEVDYVKMLDYSILNGEVTIKGIKKSAYGDLIIPEEIDGCPVVEIDLEFENSTDYYANNGVKSIVIPKTVRLISEAYQFCFLTLLEAINVDPENENFSSCDGVLFNKTGTELICYPGAKNDAVYIMPDGVKKIRFSSFCENSYLKEIVISDSLEFLWEYMKYELSLQFALLVNLEKIEVNAGNKYYSSQDGILYNKEKTELLFVPNKNKTVNFEIPEGVESILSGAIQEENQTVKRVKIPESMNDLGDGFYNFLNLERIEVEDKNNVYLSEDGVLFSKDKTKLVTFPAGSFVTEYTVPEEVMAIGDCAFKNCKNLTNASLPVGLESIGESAFAYCVELSSINIPEKINVIEKNTFYFCSKLSRVDFGIGITVVKNSAFKGDDSLYSITYAGKESEWKNIIIEENNECLNLAKITFEHIPETAMPENDSLFTYSIKNGKAIIERCSETAKGKITIPSVIDGYTVVSIGNSAFGNRTEITGVLIPDSVTSIESSAFYGCTNLALVQFGKNSNLKTIGNSVFQNCKNLSSVTIPQSVSKIGDNSFKGCDSLSDVYYQGSKFAWNRISIGSGNASLSDASVHYERSGLLF